MNARCSINPVSYLVIAVLLALAWPCQGQDAGSANSATQDEIDAAIKIIRAAERVPDASEAYAGIARQAMDSAELRSAYVRKLVELDSPDLAYAPVIQLVKIDPNDVFARAVLGYCQGRRREYVDALSSLAKAADQGASDEPTMENLGQLVAYVEGELEPPKLSEDVEKIIAADKESWASNEAYKRGYARVAAGNQAYVDAGKELADKLAAVNAEAAEKEEKIVSLKTELDSITEKRMELQRGNTTSSGGDGGGLVGGNDADSGATIGGGGMSQEELNNLNSQRIQAYMNQEAEIATEIAKLQVELRRLNKDQKDVQRDVDRLARKRDSIIRDAGGELQFVKPVVFEVERASAAVPLEPPATPVGGQTETAAAGEAAAIIIDNDDADKILGEGEWMVIAWDGTSNGPSLLHDNNTNKGLNKLAFVPDFPAAGEYDVYLYYPAADFTATNVPVDIMHSGGTTTVVVNQRATGGQWQHLGKFTFGKGNSGAVVIRTDNTDGMVFVDAVKFVPAGEVE